MIHEFLSSTHVPLEEKLHLTAQIGGISNPCSTSPHPWEKPHNAIEREGSIFYKIIKNFLKPLLFSPGRIERKAAYIFLTVFKEGIHSLGSQNNFNPTHIKKYPNVMTTQES